MSNPMTNLKKSKKTPLPNHHGRAGAQTGQNVPFRNYTQSESQMFNEITANMAADRLKDVTDRLPRLRDVGGSTSNGSSPRSNGSSSDQELMSMMMTRLGQLEQKLQFKTKDLAESNKRTRILEDKVRILQKARDDSNPGRLQQMEKKCLLLQQQIHEMESFLADYGMVWVGSQTDKSTDVYNSEDYEELRTGSEEDGSFTRGQVHSTLWNPEESVSTEFKVDFDQVIHNINELNEVAGAGLAKIQHTTDGARLKIPEHIPLTLFANGMVLFSGPFRPYTDGVTQQCITDITDGYFPSELQTRYPEGIPFSVTDKRSVHFKDRLSQIFEGSAQQLGGDVKSSRLVPAANLDKVHSKTTQSEESSPQEKTSQLPGHKMTMEQFLNRLPASVLKEGKVIDIRKTVGGQLTGSGAPTDVTVVETEAVKNFKERRMHEQVSPRPSQHADDVTTLRVKDQVGDHTYILKMKYTETLADVRAYLNQLRPRGSCSYQIVSTFPRQVYTDMSKTLVESNLVPNATLHLQSTKPR